MVSKEDKIIFEVIKDNLKKNLSMTKVDQDYIKSLKNKIQQKMENKQYSIKTAKIAKMTVQYLINIKWIKDQKDMDEFIKKSVFLGSYVVEKDFNNYEYCEIEIDPEFLNKFDFKSLEKKHDELLKERAIQELLDKQVENQKREIREQIQDEFKDDKELLEKERSELEKLKSCIDDEIVQDEIKIIKNIESVKIQSEYLESNLLWYQELGLKGNPFPTEDGLDKFRQDLYEQIVVKTPIYKKYLKYLNTDPKVLINRSMIIYGEFGCGKTTFFDYFSYQCLQHNIFPIRILLNAEPNLSKLWETFRYEFLDQLANQLSSVGTDPRSYIQKRDNNDILNLFNMITCSTNFKSFIIFLDGLHKSQDNQDIPLKFLIELQNFLDYFKRKNIPLSIFIAGTNEWIQNINYSSKVSGSVYSDETIRGITAEDAFEMLKNRFLAFSEHKSEEDLYFSFEDIQQLLNTAKKIRASEISFRVFIKEFLKRGFVVDNKIKFDLKLERDILQTISEIFSNEQNTFKILKKFVNECKLDNSKLVLALNFISLLFEKGGILDNTPLCIQNKSLLALLINRNIVKKAIRKDGKIIFQLENEIYSTFRKIDKKVKFSPRYYLNKILCESKEEIYTESERDKIIETLNRWIISNSQYENNLKEILRITKERYLPLLMEIEKNPDFQIQDKDMSEMDDLIEVLLKFLYLISGEPTKINDRESLFKKFKYSWLDSPELLNYFTAREKISDHIRIDRLENQRFLKIFIDAYESQIQKIGKHIRYNEILIVGSKDLLEEDKQILHAARAAFSEGAFQKSIKSFFDLTENRLREWIFNIMELKFGNDWFTKLPEKTKEKINLRKKQEKINFGKTIEQQNLIYYLDRVDYLSIITDKNLWKDCFSKILGKLNYSIIERLYDIAKNGDLDKHNRNDNQLKQISPTIKETLEKTKNIIELINHSALNFLDENMIKIEEEKVVLFDDNNNPSNSTEIVLNQKEISSFTSDLQNYINKKVIYFDNFLNIFNRNEIQNIFPLNYRDVIGMIAFLIKSRNLKVKEYENAKILFEIG